MIHREISEFHGVSSSLQEDSHASHLKWKCRKLTSVTRDWSMKKKLSKFRTEFVTKLEASVMRNNIILTIIDEFTSLTENINDRKQERIGKCFYGNYKQNAAGNLSIHKNIRDVPTLFDSLKINLHNNTHCCHENSLETTTFPWAYRTTLIPQLATCNKLNNCLAYHATTNIPQSHSS